MKVLASLCFLFLSAGQALWADARNVTLELLSDPRGSRSYFFHFLVDGRPAVLLCDDANGALAPSWEATMLSLADDLSPTLLGRLGDPDALDKYRRIAILDQLAYKDPSLSADVTEAIRQITDPSRPSQIALTLLAWVYEQDPAQYDLSGFRIFASPRFQEQTGDPPVPEPSSVVLVGFVVAFVACTAARRRSAAPRLHV